MKKLSFFFAVVLLLTLAGCGVEPVTFEGRSWQVQVVQTADHTEVVACSAAYAQMMKDYMDMSDVELVDVVCLMQDGIATFTDKMTNKTYVAGYSTGENVREAAYGDVERTHDLDAPFDIVRRYAFDSQKDPHGLYVIAGDYEIFFQEEGFLEKDLLT